MTRSDLIIVGSGIIGLSTAWYLRHSGLSITILEANTAGSGASYGNAGMIVPSHFVPMAAPGIISKGLRWLLRSDSPFYIRPRLNLSLLQWLHLFRKSANHYHVEQAMPILRDLSLASSREYEMLSEDLGLDYQNKGIFLLYNSKNGEKECQTLSREGRDIGIKVELYDRKGVNHLDPTLFTVAEGGAYFPQDGHLVPSKLVEKLIETVKESDVKIHHGVRVNNIRRDGSSLIVESDAGNYQSDQVVLSAGVWSESLARKLSLSLPLQGGKGYSLDIQPGKRQINTPLLLAEAKVAITPMEDRLRFAGTLELCGTDRRINHTRVQGIAKSVHQYLPQFESNDILKGPVWQGLRPCSPDGMPYIGRFKKCPSVIAATGHGMLGISLGAITGKLVAEEVMEQPKSIHSPLLSPDRFTQ